MRIVHISDCYAPRLGGIETQVRALAVRQHQGGHDVHVITATPSLDGPIAGCTGIEVLDGVTVHRLVARLPFDLPVHPKVQPEVRRTLSELAPDAVHVHGGVISPFAYPAIPIAVQLGVPTVVTIHGIWGPIMGPFAAAMDKVTHWTQWGVVVSAVSDVAADPLRRLGLPVRILPNGIDVRRWSQPAPGRRDDGVLRLISVMRLAPRKRGSALLRIVARANSRLPEHRRVHLTIVGDGPAQSLLERMGARRGLGAAITFTGRVDAAEVRTLLANSDAFIAPARRESFGIAAMEARTAGLPVIALEGTGITSFVRDGVEGLLGADDGQLVDAVVTMAIDGDLRNRISAHNRTVPPVQDWAHVLRLVEAAYHDAAGRRELPVHRDSTSG